MPNSRHPLLPHAAKAHIVALVVWLSLSYPTRARAQQQSFGLELSFGPTVGLTSYRTNQAYIEPTEQFDTDLSSDATGTTQIQPFLADELYGWGSHFGARLLIDQLSFGFAARIYPRERIRVHHVGDRTLSQSKRRPDGSLDDTGVRYTELDEPRTITSTQRNRGSLLVLSIGGGWRVPLIRKDIFEFFAPLGAGLVVTNVDEPGLPYLAGLDLQGGLGTSFALSERLTLSGVARMNLSATLQYDDDEIASRRAVELSQNTAQALFSTFIHPSFEFGVVYWFR